MQAVLSCLQEPTWLIRKLRIKKSKIINTLSLSCWRREPPSDDCGATADDFGGYKVEVYVGECKEVHGCYCRLSTSLHSSESV